jgi:hypothetical protein
MDTRDALLEKYRSLLSFYLHQDRIATDLIYIFAIISSGLLSAVAFLASGETRPGRLIDLLCIAGAVVSLGWAIIFYRNTLYRVSSSIQARAVEKELGIYGLGHLIFEVREKIYREKKVIKNIKGEFRSLRIWERISTFKLFHFTTFCMAIFWLTMDAMFHIGWI